MKEFRVVVFSSRLPLELWHLYQFLVLYTPDRSPKTPATGKQSRSGDGVSSQPGTWPMSVHKSKKKSKSAPGKFLTLDLGFLIL
jgi:hypothetical protein